VNIVDPRLERYLEGLLDDPDPVQREMEELARRRGFPIVGPLVGRLLMLLAKATAARRILELGSGFGYSALWFARALPDDGEIVLTEYDRDDSDRSRDFLAGAGLAGKATFLVGDALQLVNSIAGPFDIVFIDVDKEQYPAALDKALPLLRPGGLLIADNVLWQGRVVDEEPPEPSTAGILEFNRRIHADPRLEVAMVPLRDGLAICRLRS
jgi:predicted O-methyltransferase YrrM